nr:CS1 fimbrial subunit B flags: Precursor [Stenotrophomonas geniculata]
MRHTLMALALMSLAATGQAAAPKINVGPMFDYMPASSSHFLKRVRNSGDATAYVRVEITRIDFDPTGKAMETPVDAAALARSEPGANGLIASPSRMIIPGNNGMQATRLIHRGNRDSEQYFRVRYVPVMPESGEFSMNEQQSDHYKQTMNAGVSIFTGFGTVVFVPPSNARYDTSVEGGQVSNRGNATIVLDNVKLCQVSNPDQCSKGKKIHLRPGQSHTLVGDANEYSRFDLIEGGARRSLTSQR